MNSYSIVFRIIKIVTRFLLKFENLSGAKECRSRRSRKMLQNAPTLAIVAVDTEENERLRFGVNYSVYSFTSLLVAQIPLRPFFKIAIDDLRSRFVM